MNYDKKSVVFRKFENHLIWLSVLIFLFSASSLMAIATNKIKGKLYPWDFPCGGWQEKEMFDAGVKGWYLPIGPTGIRAMITEEDPCHFKVMYVFRDSPAHGLVKPGDIIVGANGITFKQPHVFGRKVYRSWKGPITDMAARIENSQEKDGRLELMIRPKGETETKTVEVKIPAIGRFSDTYPFDCERSEKTISMLCDYLVKEYRKKGKFQAWAHTRAHCYLALMASGNPEYDDIIKKKINGILKHEPDTMKSTQQCWTHGYDGILLGEYYLKYKDERVIPYAKKLCKFYRDAMGYDQAGYSHNPRPAIVERIVSKNGGYGYGAMASPSGLAMLAMSLFKAGGIEIDDMSYKRIHQAYLRHARPDCVRVVYHFRPWQSVHIELKDPARAKSDQGTGYLSPAGMKGITDYKVLGYGYNIGKEKDDGKERKAPDWLEAERDRNIVFDWGGGHRYIVRNPDLPEPEAPYKTTRACAQAPVGLGALAHLIGNKNKKSWNYLGMHAANSCALGYGSWFDGHASASMHQLWVALGASRADKKLFRKFMDECKWWFIMQQTHDGSYLVCPNRDRPTNCNSDLRAGPHMLATANAVIILSLSRRALQITGKENLSSKF